MMKHNKDDTINTGNEGSHKFCWPTNSPSSSSTPSPIPLVHSFQEIKENMSENTAFSSAIASRKRGRAFKPVAP